MTSRYLFEDLSLLARHEAHRKSLHRPPYYLHKWWARRTGSVMRGTLLDLLLPEGESRIDAFYRAHDFSGTVVLDPFMGGGTALGEALRLGCSAIGSDINPVAWFLVKRSLATIDLDAVAAAFAVIEAEAAQPITDMYRTKCVKCGTPATAQHTLWTQQLACRACGELVDLNLDQVLMRSFGRGGDSLVDCPACGCIFRTGQLDAEVECPDCFESFVPREKRCRSTDYRCRCGCQEAIIEEKHLLDDPLPYRMRAITVVCDACGRVHQRPSDEDEERYRAIALDVSDRMDSLMVPKQSIPPGRNTDQLRRHGFHFWNQLFNARQLAALDLLFRSIGQLEDQSSRELLLLLASASLEFNSMLCTAKGLGTGAIRQVFTHHALIPARVPLEANVWGDKLSSGGFSTIYHERVRRSAEWARHPSERRPVAGKKTEKVSVEGEKLAGRPASHFEEIEEGTANLLVFNRSSEHLAEIPDEVIDFIITDPPYGDSVMYSELSDYFYVWLRLVLQDTYPASFGSPLVEDAREAVHNDGRDRSAAFYSEVVGNVLSEASRTLKPGGRLVFSFHHGNGDTWRSLEDAVVQAGFVVERWWPVFAEMESSVLLHKKDNNGQLDIIFFCAKAGEIEHTKSTASIEEIRSRLESHISLVPADYRALAEAAAVQEATWKRSAESTSRRELQAILD